MVSCQVSGPSISCDCVPEPLGAIWHLTLYDRNFFLILFWAVRRWSSTKSACTSYYYLRSLLVVGITAWP